MDCVSTLEIVKDYFRFRLNEGKNLAEQKSDYFSSIKFDDQSPSQKIFATIRQLAYNAELQNRECFDHYIKCTFEKIDDLKNINELEKKLRGVAELLFNDNEISWSRIIIILSVVTYLTYKYAWIQRDLVLISSFACRLIEWITSYFACKFGMWIECQGGWV
jgi:hypothetical protein